MPETEKHYDPEKRHEYYERQKARKQNLENSLLGIAGLTLDKILELMKEFYRTANSNPAVGVATSLITVDILFRLKIIDKETAIAVMVMLGALDGAQIAGTIIEDFASITHFFSKSPSNMDLKPSATTIVYAEGSNDSSLMKALLTREGVKG
jgi:hypothetical protein